jgi:hypothetical protein
MLHLLRLNLYFLKNRYFVQSLSCLCKVGMFLFSKSCIMNIFRKLVGFIQFLILNTITKLYSSGGMTTFVQSHYFYNVSW